MGGRGATIAMDGSLVKELLSLYGPLAIGWIVAIFLAWRVFTERDKPSDTFKAYKDICEDYHAAIVENTRVTERLALLIEERTRRVTNGER